MKPFNRFTKICLTLLFIGLSLTGVGFLLGGWKNLEQEVTHNRRLETVDFDKVESLEIQTSIILAPSKDDQFHLSYYHYLKDKTVPVRYQLNDKKLTVTDNQQNSFVNVNGLVEAALHLSQQNWVEDRIPRLEIPKGTNLKELTGFVDIGNIDLEDVKIDHLQLTVNVGPVNLSNANIGRIDLGVDTGDIRLTNVRLASKSTKEDTISSHEGLIQLNVGKITATNLHLAGKNSMFTDVGSIDLQLHPQSAVSVEANADVGSVSNHFQYPGNPQGQLTLQVDSGDIRVR
ncbi:hypothetical protein BU202_02920 [Streptococcus cuniculi]|uniref:DUF4097 domain-containing protein n=1 Tax=Streptococcus cuniculi TaxID=1432788 RepID=A0A1Q8E9W4_9STRE|nr:DUF4097 family beta strand repeat-containing protein [Streptococcus cuniculi]OLF48586.1 hypothetical protein BU202_02920 [Streptococcus cuniculi]